MHARQRLGRWGEAVAVRFLRYHGWSIIDRNWHCHSGEIDIVARHDTEWLFVEVKTRRSLRSGEPATAWTIRQQCKLQLAIGSYIEQAALSASIDWRMALVTVQPNGRTTATVGLVWPEDGD